MADTFGLNRALAKESKNQGELEKVQADCTARAKRMLSKQIKPARSLITSKGTHEGACPPRRAGKTYCAGSLALITGEAKPRSVTVVISLTLPQLRKIWWDDPGGIIKKLDRDFDLKLEFHDSFFRWTHQNGSVGYLLSCEDKKRMEYARGIEADLYIIDEAQAFAPGPLRYLLETIIEPQRRSRQGRVVLIGTPGPIESGPFFDATCSRARHPKTKLPLSVAYGEKDPTGRDPKKHQLWTRHHWTLKDNTALPHQWEEAVSMKESKGWADDHPVWLRESKGEWAGSFDGLIYRYVVDKPTGNVSWVPQPTADNPTGLPEEEGPWRLIAGMDLGFEDATALVVCAYSQKRRELRHVADFTRTNALVQDVAALVQDAQAMYGRLDVIFVDQGNLGKMIVRSLIAEHGFPLEPAEKREKFDHITLVNSGFAAGEIKIIDGSPLSDQLESQQWKLDDGVDDDPQLKRRELARAGKLKEHDGVPNDLSDAFLYCYRGAQHHYANPAAAKPTVTPGSPDWERKRREEELRKFRARPNSTPQARALQGRPSLPASIKQVLQAPWNTKTSMPSRRS